MRPIRRERRMSFRLGWHLPATIYDVGRHLERPCVLVDISNGGAKIAGISAHTIPDEFRLRTPLGDRRSCRVIWRTDDTLGVEFTDLVDGEDSSGHPPAAREPTSAWSCSNGPKSRTCGSISRPVRLRPSIRRWSRAGFLRNPQADRVENQWRVSICSQVPRRSWCPELAPMPRILGLPARRLHRRPRRQLRRLLWAAVRRGAIVQDGTSRQDRT